MPVIEITTMIAAPIERVFDLSRSIDFHLASTDGTDERAVAGRTSGLIALGEHVTWEARHLGVRRHLTVAIMRYNRPGHFQDAMLRGAFKHMIHDHHFVSRGAGTRMDDRFDFSAPFGPLGRMAEALFLTRYLRRFLAMRNAHLKRVAESEEWRRYLPA